MLRWSAAPKAGVGPEWADDSTDAANTQDKTLLAHYKKYIHQTNWTKENKENKKNLAKSQQPNSLGPSNTIKGYVVETKQH